MEKSQNSRSTQRLGQIPCEYFTVVYRETAVKCQNDTCETLIWTAFAYVGDALLLYIHGNTPHNSVIILSWAERDDNEGQTLQSLFLFDEGSLLSTTISLSRAGLVSTKGQLRYLYLQLKSCQRMSLIPSVCVTRVGESLLSVVAFNGRLLSVVRHWDGQQER